MSDVGISQKPQTPNAQAGSSAAEPVRPNDGARRIAMSAEKAMEHVQKLYDAGRHDQALKICLQIVAQRPRMAEAHNLMAAILHAQGKSPAAVKSLQRAINLNGNNVCSIRISVKLSGGAESFRRPW